MEATVNGIAAPPSPNGPLTVGLAAPPAAAAAVQVVLVGAPQQQAPDGQAAGPSDDAMLMPRNLHHLTRHWIPPAARGGSAVEKLGAKDARSAENKIRGMGQRELRASFQKVYGSATNSYNNNWLRRKLYEAIGAPNSAARRVRQRNVRRANTQAAEAEALEALAEIAAGSPMRKRPGNDGAPDSQSDADNVSSERHNNGEYAAPAGDSDAREFGERQGENE